MKKQLVTLFSFIIMGTSLTACSMMSGNSSKFEQGAAVQPNVVADSSLADAPALTGKQAEESIGGDLRKQMSSADRSKLSHALDNPPGKATQWQNINTKTFYTVVPTKKLVIADNPYCRAYSATVVKGDEKQEFNGTACVAADGSWQEVQSQ